MTLLLEMSGRVGFLLIEASYVPQIIKLFRMKEAEEFSLLFPSSNLLGRIFAVTYSIAKGDSVFVGGLALGILLRIILLSQVLWYRHRRRERLRLQQETVSI